MDNLETNLKNIQGQIDTLNKQLSEAQNSKISAEAFLQNHKQELDGLNKQLQELTGLTDLNDIQVYLHNRETELNGIINDVTAATANFNSQYTFTENDVQALKSIIDKYNIPIMEGQ